MIQKKVAILALTGVMVVSLSAFADPKGPSQSYSKGHSQSNQRNSAQRFTDTAKVTYVEPVYRTVRINRPERECWDEDRTVEHQGGGGGNKTAGGIIGGIIGGAAGSQVGKGKGRTAATIVGALLGSQVGKDMSDGGHGGHADRTVETETVCRNTNNTVEEERLTGYRVNYRYQGRNYETFMKRRPGSRLTVRVKVVPVLH